SIADVFSALVEDRPYRTGMTGQEALNVLRDLAARHKIDPKLVNDVATELDTITPLVSKYRT
ncbi:MAG: hypothetical protein H6Q62_577, partial [Firmicutes bacterium]|nr:hypothetical protein [Bacillota bacterium]